MKLAALSKCANALPHVARQAAFISGGACRLNRRIRINSAHGAHGTAEKTCNALARLFCCERNWGVLHVKDCLPNFCGLLVQAVDQFPRNDVLEYTLRER